jgi:Ribbon-helix-helix protein, copG family
MKTKDAPSQPPPAKLGRPSRFGHPMTEAERKTLERAGKKQAGIRQVNLDLPAKTVERLDELSLAERCSRSEYVRLLVDRQPKPRRRSRGAQSVSPAKGTKGESK